MIDLALKMGSSVNRESILGEHCEHSCDAD